MSKVKKKFEQIEKTLKNKYEENRKMKDNKYIPIKKNRSRNKIENIINKLSEGEKVNLRKE